MTPLQIEILMHYKVSGDDFRGGDFSAPTVRSEIDWMKSDGAFLKPTTHITNTAYELTGRGHCFVDAILNLPMPVWVMPNAKLTSGAIPEGVNDE